MKKAFLTFLVIIMAVAVLAFGASAYETETYSIDIPSDYQQVDMGLGDMVTCWSTDNDSMLMLFAIENAYGADFSMFDDATLESMSDMVKSMLEGQGIGEVENVNLYKSTLNGRECVVFGFDIVTQGMRISATMYLFATEDHMYMIETIPFNDSDADELENVIATFEIKDGGTSSGTTIDEFAETPADEAEIEEIFAELGIEFDVPEKYGVAAYTTYYEDESCVIWNNDDYSFELDLYFAPNTENNVYINNSDDVIDDLLDDTLDYFEYYDVPVSESSAENVVINGFEGIKATYVYEVYGESYTEYDYYFSTKDTEYLFEFYITSDEADECHNDIISSLKIDGKPYNGAELPEGDIEMKEHTVDGLTITIPDFAKEDSEWAEENEAKVSWISDDTLFQATVYTESNKELKWMYTDFTDEDFKNLFDDVKDKNEYITDEYTAETVTINGFEGVKLVVKLDEEGFEYTGTFLFFSTKDYIYQIDLFSAAEDYDKYINDAVNSIKIDGKAFSNKAQVILYAVIAVVAVIASVVSAIIKKKKRKNQNLPEGYIPMNPDGTPMYFNPQADSVNPQVQNTPEGFVNNNGYVENNGYAPDYNYSNNLDTTVTETNDFSVTEYRNELNQKAETYSGDVEE